MTLLLLLLAGVPNVSGHVLDEQGEPIAGATVTVHCMFDESAPFGWHTKTDRNGDFGFSSKDGYLGRRELCFLRAARGKLLAEAQPLRDGNEPRILVMTEARRTYKGKLRSEQGKPIAAGWVEVNYFQNKSTVLSGADGSFEVPFPKNALGAELIAGAAGHGLVHRPERPTEHADPTWTLPRMHLVRGTLTSAEPAPFAHTTVCVTFEGEDVVLFCQTPDERGRFETRLLGAGEYFFTANPVTTHTGTTITAKQKAFANLSLTGAGPTDFTMALDAPVAGATHAITVTARVPGRPEVPLTAELASPDGLQSYQSVPQRKGDATVFGFNEIPSGIYRVTFNVERTPIHKKELTLGDADLTLEVSVPLPGVLRVHVIDQEGLGVRFASGSLARGGLFDGMRMASLEGKSDTDGILTYSAVPAATPLRLFVSHGRAGAVNVDVPPIEGDKLTDFELKVADGTTLYVCVVDQNRQPVTDAILIVRQNGGRYSPHDVKEDGCARVRYLGEAHYTLSATLSMRAQERGVSTMSDAIELDLKEGDIKRGLTLSLKR